MNKFLNFFSKLFLLFSFIIFIFILYKYKIYNFSKLDSSSLKYFYFFGLIFLFSVIFYFTNNKFREKLFLVSLSILFSLYLFEGYLVFNQYKSSVKYHAKKNDKFYDDRSRYGYFLERSKENPNIVVSLPPFVIHREYFRNPNFFSLLPLGGLSKKQTIFCNESGSFVEYLSDRYGFNNPDKEWDKTQHILLLGDSYVHGVCVNEANSISGNLRSKINSNELGIINLGQRGNGPLSELATLIEYITITNPEKIFWFYYEGNDLKNLRYENRIHFIKNYLEQKDYTQNLIKSQKLIDDYLHDTLNARLEFEKRTFHYLKEHKFLVFLKLKRLRDSLKKIQFKKEKKNYNKEIIEFKKILKKANNIIKKSNAEFYFVYIPSFNRLNGYELADEGEEYYQKIEKIVGDLNIEFLDLNKELSMLVNDKKSLFPFGLPKHFNSKGYQHISQILINKFFQ